MTLEDLMNGTQIQGDVRLSVWKEEEESAVKCYTGVDDLAYIDIPADMADMRVKYMFCPGDGYLHIELEGKTA